MQFLINIDVEDLQRAIEFYCDAFDLRLGRRFGAAGVELLGGNAPVYLLEKAAGTPVAGPLAQTRRYERHWTPVHLDMLVNDIDAAVARAVAAGARLESEIRINKWGAIAGLADPFGNGFCLLEFRGRGYDEICL